MTSGFLETFAVVIPVYAGFGFMYYKLGKIEQKVDLMNGNFKRSTKRKK